MGIFRNKRLLLLFPIYTFFLFSVSFAQRSQYYQDNERALKDGIDLFQKQKYGAAQSRFYDLLQSEGQLTEYAKSEATYYYAASAVELFHDNAEYLMTRFIQAYPESPKVVQAHFQLGKLYFRKKDYPNAIREFKASDVFLLSRNEYFEYHYKLGYSQFMTGDEDGALKSLAEVKDRKNPYQVPATYYYGHICYIQKKYETALQHFLAIKDDKNFSKIVPFYIAQIYFVQKKYEETVTYAEPIADTLKGKNSSIIRRILAESHYELKNYPKATENYEQYLATGNSLDRNGNYRLGLCYYNGAKYESAALYLKNTTTENDSMSQSAYYYMADCLIRTNNKMLALDALKLTYSLDFNKNLSKEALFNFAKLSYELGYNPYNEAIDALQLYIEKYPDAGNLDEVYELLVNIYMTVHNYRDALVSLEKIKNKSTRLKIAEQRIYLFRGMELFNNLDYANAIAHFEKAVGRNYDHKLSSEAKFWMADAHYRTQDYGQAVSMFGNFLVSPSAKDIGYYNDAYYNLGYAYYKQKNYNSALTEFRNYTDGSDRDPRKLNDAYVRVGDCFFVSRNFQRALEYYNKAIALNKLQNDYAYFQKGIILGLTGDQAGKAKTLNEALSLYPNTSYKEEISYELGLANQRLGNNSEAIHNFETIVNAPQPGKLLVKSYLQLGSLYNNTANYSVSLGWYKRVVAEFPNTREAQEAIKSIQSIYVKQGDIEGYTTYLQTLDNVMIDQGEIDSASFEAAENIYSTGDCVKSADAMGKYINNFPRGAFLLDAHHYKAECHYELKEYDQALINLEYIIGQRKNDYTENALTKTAWIYEQKKDSVNLVRIYTAMESAAESPALLQKARIGLMRNHFRLQNYEQAIQYAKQVQTFDKLDPATDEQAYYIAASSYYQLGRTEEAYPVYKKLQSKTSSEHYPEASYRMAEYQYNRQDYKTAEKILRSSVKYMGGQKDWLARSFILLSDIYVSMGNYIEAKSVLQTVIDKHDGQDLIDMAQQKYNAILDMERGNNEKQFEEQMEFDLQDNKPRTGNTDENNIQN